jgi:hypothetical protein
LAFIPKGGLPVVNSAALKPGNSTAIQPAHSMMPAIPPATAPASEDVMKSTSSFEASYEQSTIIEAPFK